MAELVNKYFQRVIFPCGRQRVFIEHVQIKTGKSLEELAKIINISSRTLRDWKKENFSLSLYALNRFRALADLPLPRNIQIMKPFWYVAKAAKIGGEAIIKKYGRIGGNPEIRKKKWYEWWEKEGKNKFSPITQPLPFVKPKKSKALSEFIGIMIGDGGMSNRQINITLNRINDKNYCSYIRKLIKKLFGVKPSLYIPKRSSVYRIVVSRVNLVKFLHQYGLPIGNKIKNEIDVPAWILKNNAYMIECLRGLVDTDGSVIIHKYNSNNNIYVYKKIGFTSRSTPLLNSVSAMLSKINIKHRINGECDIRIENKSDVKRYFTIVGSHNQKHLERYNGNFGEVPERLKGAVC